MGGILGGGSSINFMMYTRAQGVDFDSWATEGWAAKDMLPLCNKLETYHPQHEGADKSKHGYEGPIHISDGGFRGKSEAQFMETVKVCFPSFFFELGFGRRIWADENRAWDTKR
jgi:alcohol oxidase